LSIACVQWQLFDAGNQANWVSGPIKIMRLGYFWWDINGYSLGLDYIRFEDQIFIPPTKLVTGYNWNLAPGVTGTFTHTYTKLNELPVDVITEAIGLAVGNVGGLRKLGLGGLEGAVPTVTKYGQNQRLRGYISN